ncbi:MAG: dihydrofolate reductase [Butyricicoccus sp.]|nr:dihydrofolate reductase [Butyricicoccus sp.]
MDAIVAVYSDWGIGCGGTQPVTLRADRRRFREVTEGAAVIVGRKTLADFPGGAPLKGRVNIVLTRREPEIPGAVIAHDAAAALAEAKKYPRAIVIGGESVYRQLLPHIDRVFVTKIAAAPRSDVFFPDLDAAPDWRVTDPGEELEEDGVVYRFVTYERA